MACLRPIAPDDGFAGRTPWDRSALAAADHIKEYANIMPYFVCARWPVPRRLYSLEREKEDCLWMLLADKPLFARANPCKQTDGDNPTQPHRHPGGATPSQWHGPC